MMVAVAGGSIIATRAIAQQTEGEQFHVPAEWKVSQEQLAHLQSVIKATLSEAERMKWASNDLHTTGQETPRVRFGVCFKDPPTPDLAAALEEADLEAAEFNALTSWHPVGVSAPVHLTVSFVPDLTFIPTNPGIPGDVGGPSDLIARMNALFANVGGQAAWTGAVMAAFQRWAFLTGTSYTFVQDDGAPMTFQFGGTSTRGDVRIGGRKIGTGTSSNVLGFNSFPPFGDMVFNTAFGASTWASGSPEFRVLRNTTTHEHGHGLGMDHVCPQNSTKVLEPSVNTNFSGPQHDDIRGVHKLYGDALEPNGGVSSTSFLGTISTSQPILPSISSSGSPVVIRGSRTSIHRTGDEDWYRFRLTTSWNVVITVTPVGTSYTSGMATVASNGLGTCTPSTSNTILNSESQANLGIEVYRTGCFVFGICGNDRVAGATSRPRGQAESLTVSLGPTPTNCSQCNNGVNGWFIRVFSTDNPTGVQLYRLAVSGNEPLTLTASDGEHKNQIRLSWPAHGGQSFIILRSAEDDVDTAAYIADRKNGHYVDTDVIPGQTFYYWLQSTELETGPEVLAGPETGYARP